MLKLNVRQHFPISVSDYDLVNVMFTVGFRSRSRGSNKIGIKKSKPGAVRRFEEMNFDISSVKLLCVKCV